MALRPFQTLVGGDSLANRTTANLDATLRPIQAFIEGIEGEGWVDLKSTDLKNSWRNFDATDTNPAGYCIDVMGWVHLRGTIAGGTAVSGTLLFILPPGLRPYRRELFAVDSNGAYGQASVLVDGSVVIGAGVNTAFCLDGSSFRAYQ